jgi:type IV secretory pathway TrbD component
LDVPHQFAFHALTKITQMNALLSILIQAHPLEGWFFGSGKAMVVLAVALILLVGFGLWMWRAESRLKTMEAKLKPKNQQET